LRRPLIVPAPADGAAAAAVCAIVGMVAAIRSGTAAIPLVAPKNPRRLNVPWRSMLLLLVRSGHAVSGGLLRTNLALRLIDD
jgi:hypothetical protein